MSQAAKCNTNPTAKWIRVIISLGVIGAGIYYKNWIGLLGIVTLLSAFTGSCSHSLQFGGPEGTRRGCPEGTRRGYLRSIRIKRNVSDGE